MEIEVMRAGFFLRGMQGALPAEVSPPPGGIALLYFASGLKAAAMRLHGGRVFHRVADATIEGHVFLVPHGATLDIAVAEDEIEALLVEFRCPQLRFLKSNARFALDCPDGSRQSVRSFARLSTYEVALLRPMAEASWKHLPHPAGGGRHLFGMLNFQAILARLFVIPQNMKYWGRPGVVLEKTIEVSPVATRVKDIARRIRLTPDGLRKSFKALTGNTPRAYMEAQTLHLARYWILDTALPFKTVAERMGFNSASYFTRYIARRTGRTPRQIRAARRWP